MDAASRRVSTMAGSDHASSGRPTSSDEKKDIWSSMLDGVSSGKRLPEKSLLVLGGTPDTQKDFLTSLSTDPSRRTGNRSQTRQPPVANQFALGYTYQDVLDTDHEDILARLSLYLLTDPSPSFTPLLKPLMNPRTLPNMMIVVLLDWSHPWAWLRQLREWIQVLRGLLFSLDVESKDVMEENIEVLQNRGRGTSGEGNSDNVSIPLGPGEWDEPLGVPLCVVCQNADKIEQIEKERGWKEEEFDFILQYMRTVLLKHGGSLIYTMPSDGGALQTLIHSTLGIRSMLKREQLKHNVIDRDHILVPPNWDSWGKIRIMREGFEVEKLSESWSVEIQGPMKSQQNGEIDTAPSQEEEATAVAVYEDTIRDPDKDSALMRGTFSNKTNGIEVESTNNQEFLTGQLEQLEKLRAEDEKDKSGRESKKAVSSISHDGGASVGSGVVEEHIGPVQFNMGGIQVDADDMLKRLKDREANRPTEPVQTPIASPTGDEGKSENEVLKDFFAGLIKRGGNSAQGSPARS